jgi:hypothetical protein
MMQNGGNFWRSTSRMTLFHHCNKKYFFQYYTNYFKNISPDIRLDTLLLKNLTSFKMRLGEKTHHLIADYLRLLLSLSSWAIAKDLGDKKDFHPAVLRGKQHSEWLINLKASMRTTMEQEFHLAKSRQYKRYDKDQKFGFKEFCYGGKDAIHRTRHPEQSEGFRNELQWEISLEDGVQKVLWNLDAFIASPLHDMIVGYFNAWYKAYIESNQSDFEQMKLVLDHHPVLQDVTIRAGPDFGITAADNTYYIYDRKSWTEKDIPQDIITDQLKVYAYKLLYNTSKTLDDVTIYAYEVYLPSMYMIGGKVSQADIDHIKDKIVDDVHELQALVVDGNIKKNIPKHMDNFRRTSDSSKCMMCSMRRVCAALKKIDGDSQPNPILDTIAWELDHGRLF